MTDDERATPDSLRGKLRDLFANDDDHRADASTKLETDAGAHAPAGADEPEPVPPRRPTDPPF